MKLYEDLKWRGLIKDETPGLKEKLNDEKLTFYIGTDPTADSLHIGHLSSFLIAKRLSNYGHKPILLVGGATGLIGDPRLSSERPMISKETLNDNYKSLKKQVENLFNIKSVNNYDWAKNINFIDYLRDFGKYFSINYMLAKDTVKSRLNVGITYTEFSYMIIQALDYLHLNENYNCTLQFGGQDQWGNITSGVELIRKKSGTEVNAFTAPLITKADGTKFGKSEGGTLWLDKNKTSSYAMYQFLINSDDSKVIEYLKYLTFLSKPEIEILESSLEKEPHLRKPHQALAKEVIVFLHGEEEYANAVNVSKLLFEEAYEKIKYEDIKVAFNGVPTFTFKESNIIDLLVNENICSSKREARELVASNAISINGKKINSEEEYINSNHLIHDKILILRKGKKKYFLGQVES